MLFAIHHRWEGWPNNIPPRITGVTAKLSGSGRQNAAKRRTALRCELPNIDLLQSAVPACGWSRHAGIRKPCMGPWKSSREFTACDFFLQLHFFVRLESPFLRPDPQCPNAVARRVCQGWPSLRYLLMISAMPGHTLTNPSTAARSLWSGWTGRGGARLSRTNIRAATLYSVGRNDPGP
jgi:hypothetical protein